MIVSNVAAGDFLAEKLNSGIFNIHCGFDMQKKKDIVELLEKEKCPFDEDKLDTIEEYNKVRRFAVDNNNDYLDGRIRNFKNTLRLVLLQVHVCFRCRKLCNLDVSY